MTAKLITTPGGEKLAILPAEEYEDLRTPWPMPTPWPNIARAATKD